jgi:hypothetical protein
MTSALIGAGLMTSVLAAQAGGYGGGGCGSCGGRPGVGSNMNVFAPVTVTNNINRSFNMDVNSRVNVYAPVTVNKHIDNSSYVDTSTNIDTSSHVRVDKDINVRNTNIWNYGVGGWW